MRNIVKWYDKRHSKASPNKIQKETDEINRFQVELGNLSHEFDRLQLKYDSRLKENEDLKRQMSDLKMSLEDRIQSFTLLQRDFSELVSVNETLTGESRELRKRCLTESDVPSMIYFAQGDTTGLWLRKVSAVKSIEHMYKLTTKQGDISLCNFSPINHNNMSDVIANRNITLLACDIISITPAASAIEIIEEGVATLENNRWKVTSKAKIKLV